MCTGVHFANKGQVVTVGLVRHTSWGTRQRVARRFSGCFEAQNPRICVIEALDHAIDAFSRQWASLLIVARQVSCHPAETTGVVLQWHGKSPWSRDERSITRAELGLAFCVFVQGKRLANLTVLRVSPARRERHGDRLNCPCSLWLLLHDTHAGSWACTLASTWTKVPATRWLPG